MRYSAQAKEAASLNPPSASYASQPASTSNTTGYGQPSSSSSATNALAGPSRSQYHTAPSDQTGSYSSNSYRPNGASTSYASALASNNAASASSRSPYYGSSSTSSYNPPPSYNRSPYLSHSTISQSGQRYGTSSGTTSNSYTGGQQQQQQRAGQATTASTGYQYGYPSPTLTHNLPTTWPKPLPPATAAPGLSGQPAVPINFKPSPFFRIISAVSRVITLSSQ